MEAVGVKSAISFVSYVYVLLHGCMYRYMCMGLRARPGNLPVAVSCWL